MSRLRFGEIAADLGEPCAEIADGSISFRTNYWYGQSALDWFHELTVTEFVRIARQTGATRSVPWDIPACLDIDESATVPDSLKTLGLVEGLSYRRRIHICGGISMGEHFLPHGV